jgi:hypothetical protein
MDANAWAHELINQFASRVGESVWLNVRDRGLVAAGLHARVDNPDTIDQGATNVCGIVGFMRNWAKDDPVDFAWLGIQLYETGRGRVGRGQFCGKVVAPSPELKNHSVPQGMDPADWITLASTREAFNSVFKYPDPFIGETLSAINFPSDVVAGFKAAGYTHVTDRTSWNKSVGYDNANDASDKFLQDYRVVLLINARLLNDDTARTQAVVPTSDHWVGLCSEIGMNLWWHRDAPVEADRVGVRLKVNSWGKPVSVPNNGDYLPLKTFVNHYYGFVAAKF